MNKNIFLTAFAFLFSVAFTAKGNAESPWRKSRITVRTYQKVHPLFLSHENNVVLRIEVNVPQKRPAVHSISIVMEGSTQIADVEKVRIFYTGLDSTFSNRSEFGNDRQSASAIRFFSNQKLKQGRNYFWVSYQLKDSTNLLHRFDAGLDQLSFEDGQRIKPEIKSTVGSLKAAFMLSRHGEGGIDTYRIPGLATTNDGTLLAVYDVRRNSSSDLQENIDIGMSRSTDGGQSWEPMNVILDMHEQGGLPEDQNGVGDPSILVDDQTGTVWVAALWTHGMAGKRAWFASGQGFSPDQTGQLVLVKSEDDGKTWSDPINITRQVKRYGWKLLLQGPGKGITMDDGTLVFPAQFRDADGTPHSTIIYSKNHGQTWDSGSGAKPNTTEAQVVQLKDGSLMLNMRDNRGGARSVYTTDDLGKTWKRHPTSRSALKGPVCMGSLIRFPAPAECGGWLLFSNPNSTTARKNMTVKLSTDDGMTWPKAHELLLNERNGYGYSCMSVIDRHTIGILYEGVRDLYFQKISIAELDSKISSTF